MNAASGTIVSAAPKVNEALPMPANRSEPNMSLANSVTTATMPATAACPGTCAMRNDVSVLRCNTARSTTSCSIVSATCGAFHTGHRELLIRNPPLEVHATLGSGELTASGEEWNEELPGERFLHLRDVFGRAFGDNLTAAIAPVRTEVDDPVSSLDHVKVVLDHKHGVALIDEALEHREQATDVFEVQAGGWLVE